MASDSLARNFCLTLGSLRDQTDFFKPKYYIPEELVLFVFEFLNGPVSGHYDLHNGIAIK